MNYRRNCIGRTSEGWRAGDSGSSCSRRRPCARRSGRGGARACRRWGSGLRWCVGRFDRTGWCRAGIGAVDPDVLTRPFAGVVHRFGVDLIPVHVQSADIQARLIRRGVVYSDLHRSLIHVIPTIEGDVMDARAICR